MRLSISSSLNILRYCVLICSKTLEKISNRPSGRKNSSIFFAIVRVLLMISAVNFVGVVSFVV